MPGHKLMPSRVMSAQATRGAAQRPSDAAGTARQGSRRRDYEAESAETLNLVPRARSRTRARGGVKWPRRARAKIAAPMLRGRRRRCMSLRGARVASAAIIWHFVVGEAANAAKAARAAARGGASVAALVGRDTCAQKSAPRIFVGAGIGARASPARTLHRRPTVALCGRRGGQRGEGGASGGTRRCDRRA